MTKQRLRKQADLQQNRISRHILYDFRSPDNNIRDSQDGLVLGSDFDFDAIPNSISSDAASVSPVPPKGGIRFSALLAVVFFLLLIISNVVVSSVVKSSLAWFILSFLFVALLIVAIVGGYYLLRAGYKIFFALSIIPTLSAVLYIGANVYAIVYDPTIDQALKTKMPAVPHYVFHTRQKNGQMLPIFDESERFVPSDELWQSWFARAAIAIEDERFLTRYEGPAIDVRGLARASKAWWERRRQGASTIPTQTAKLMTGVLKTETLTEKSGQWLIALRLDQRFSDPDELFCLYSNIVGLVGTKHGVGIAAADLFGVSDLRKLTIAQSALLAALLNNATIFDPRRHANRALERRNLVLNKMLELQMISPEQHQAALKEEMRVLPRIKSQELLVRAANELHPLEKKEAK